MAIETPLGEGESPVREARANLQRGAENVGGRLHLTTERLIFESHKINVQSGATTIDRSDIAVLRKAWTKSLGFIPMFPNALEVITHGGTKYRFTLSKRDAWIDAIGPELAVPG